MRNRFQKVMRALQANALGQGVSILTQLISLPMFLLAWGPQHYGAWIFLTSIPSYLAVSDLGFANVAANDMTMAKAAGTSEEVSVTYHSVSAMVSGCSAFATFALTLCAALLPLETANGISHQFTHYQTVEIILFQSLAIWFSLQIGVLGSCFRCEDRYAQHIMLGNTIRLLEFLVLFAQLSFHEDAVDVSIGLALTRCFGVLCMRRMAYSFAPWTRYSASRISLARIQKLFVPSIAFMALPLGNALRQQGIIFVIGMILNPAAVVAFSAMRTLTRFPIQISALIKNSIWAEFSTTFGRGEILVASRLLVLASRASILLGWPALLLMSLWGAQILKIWGKGDVEFSRSAFYLLAAGVGLNLFWFTTSVALESTNSHRKMAYHYLLLTVVTSLLSYPLTHSWGLLGAAASLFILEIFMFSSVLPQCWRLVNETKYSFTRKILGLRPGA